MGLGRLVSGLTVAAIVLLGCDGPVPSVTPAPTTTTAPQTATPPATGSPSPSASPSPSPTPDPLAVAPGLPYLTGPYEPNVVFIAGIDAEEARALAALLPKVLLTVDGQPYTMAPEITITCPMPDHCRLVVRGRNSATERGDTWVLSETEAAPAGPLRPVYDEARLYGVPRATIEALEKIVRGDAAAWAVRGWYEELLGATWDPRRPRVYVLVYLRPPGSGLVPEVGRPLASVGFDELHITVDAAQRRVLEVREIPFMGGA